jgi:AraC-like DNA-binding protein
MLIGIPVYDDVDMLDVAGPNELLMRARNSVSPRYVHLLFETEGLSFNKFVVERRLLRAYEMLSDSQRSDRTITAIALTAGFSDLSHFNRAFRRRFGTTPSEARHAGRDAGNA